MRNFENVLTNSCILVNRASGASTRIFEILDAKSDIHHDPESPQSEEEDFNSFDGSMILKNVSFSYPSRPKAKVLKEVSINIEKGKTWHKIDSVDMVMIPLKVAGNGLYIPDAEVY